jgi:esterase
MKLFFTRLGEGPPLFILHGFLGMSDNWHSIGKRLSQKFSVYLIDARNHGRSPHCDSFGYKEMVADLVELIQEEKINRLCVMGHSMGGKTAIHMACKYPQIIDKLVVVDISPFATIGDHEQLRLLNVMQSFEPANRRTFNALETALKPLIKSWRLRTFVLKNIRKSPDGIFSWKPNVPVLYSNKDKLIQVVECTQPFGSPVLFVKGELSNYLQSSDIPLIRNCFPNAKMLEIKGAGHWVHADKPEEFFVAVNDFFIGI